MTEGELELRYVIAVLAAAILMAAVSMSEPFLAARAQSAGHPTTPDRRFAVDWGAWPELTVGMSEQQVLSIVRRRVGVNPVAVAGSPKDPNKTLSFDYAIAGSQARESIRINKVRRSLSSMSVDLVPAIPCEKVIKAVSDVLSEPRMGKKGAISFGSGPADLAAWKDRTRDQTIVVGLDRTEPPQTCDMIAIYP